MLPSTGSFKGITCPFFENGLCERPYCHFRHVKNGGLNSPRKSNENSFMNQIVTKALKVVPMKNVLTEPDLKSLIHNLVPLISEELKSTSSQSEIFQAMEINDNFQPHSPVPTYKPTPIEELKSYNPTPIAELRKKHLPVSCVPDITTSLKRKRPSSPNKFLSFYVPYPKRSKSWSSDSSSVALSCYADNNSSTEVTTTFVAEKSPWLVSYKNHEVGPNASIPIAEENMSESIVDDNLASEFDMLEDILSETIQNAARDRCEEETNKIISENDDKKEASQDYYCWEEKYVYCSELSLGDKNNRLETSDVSKLVEQEAKTINNSETEDICTKGDEIAGLFETMMDNEDGTSSLKHDDSSIIINPSTDAKLDKQSTRSSSTSHGRSQRSQSHKHVSKKQKHKSKHRHEKTSSSKSRAKKSSRPKSTSKPSKHSSSSKRDKNRDLVKSNDKCGESLVPAEGQSTGNENFKDLANSWELESEIRYSPIFEDDSKESDSMIISDCDTDEIEEECYRIFQEYKHPPPSEHSIASNNEHDSEVITQHPLQSEQSTESNTGHDTDVTQVVRRRRIAHEAASKIISNSHLKRPLTNTSRIVSQRYKAVKEKYELNKETQLKKVKEQQDKIKKIQENNLMEVHIQKMRALSGLNPEIKGTTEKIRIAHVPNVANILEEKRRLNKFTLMSNLLDRQRQKKFAATSSQQGEVMITTSKTITKGSSRKAHLPSVHLMEKPVILPQLNMKIPLSKRQKSLLMLMKEYKLYQHSSKDAFKLAEEQEEEIYEKSKCYMTYSNSLANVILNIRKEMSRDPSCLSNQVSEEQKSDSELHSSFLKSRRKELLSREERQNTTSGFSFYEKLREYVLTEKQLVENGFPRKHPTKTGSAVVKLKYGRNEPVIPNRRTCSRCNLQYEINGSGEQVIEETCWYHSQKLFSDKYGCCQGDIRVEGCTESPRHVCANFQVTNFGFQQTLPPGEHPENGDYGVYAIDCEMCYTTLGFELVRVTVVDEKLATVVDKFVRPKDPIVDYGTRFSGVSEKDLIGVDTTIHQVQAALLTFINERTILVGHSLDSDLRALKLIHDVVVDTSVVFPHRDPTKKKALKTLANTILNKAIQQGLDGHDSVEDAVTAMQLMLHKIRG